MQVNATYSDNYCLLNIIGRIDSYTIPQLKLSLNKIKSMGLRHIIIDLSKIDYISSSGLLIFVQTKKSLMEQDLGEVYLAGAPDVVFNSFALAGFDKIFKFFPTSQSAIESVKGGN